MPKAGRTYVTVLVRGDGAFGCPAPSCAFLHKVYRRVYNHYTFSSESTGHTGLLCRTEATADHPPQGQPSCIAAAAAAPDIAQSDSQDTTSDIDIEALADAPHAPATEIQSSLEFVQARDIHSLPAQCKSSVLIHGHLQGIIPIERLHAAAAECYSGTEAWLDRATVDAIKNKAVLSLHHDKNQHLRASYCNDLFARFHQRVDSLVNTTDDAAYWESLVHESVAAVAYLSFCLGQAAPIT